MALGPNVNLPGGLVGEAGGDGAGDGDADAAGSPGIFTEGLLGEAGIPGSLLVGFSLLGDAGGDAAGDAAGSPGSLLGDAGGSPGSLLGDAGGDGPGDAFLPAV